MVNPECSFNQSNLSVPRFFPGPRFQGKTQSPDGVPYLLRFEHKIDNVDSALRALLSNTRSLGVVYVVRLHPIGPKKMFLLWQIAESLEAAR